MTKSAEVAKSKEEIRRLVEARGTSGFIRSQLLALMRPKNVSDAAAKEHYKRLDARIYEMLKSNNLFKLKENKKDVLFATLSDMEDHYSAAAPGPVNIRSRGAVKWASGEALIPEGLVIEVCRSTPYDPRYQLPPGHKVSGDFSKLGIGRYVA